MNSDGAASTPPGLNEAALDRPRTRLIDVALAAGVSVKTVSNVVNDYPHVTAATRAKVEQAIAELGYKPNVSARSLRVGHSGVIALAVPELDIPYFAELARHVVRAAEARGWTVLVDQTGGRRDRERLAADGIRSGLIDGLIFSPLALTANDLAERTDDTPMVLLGERIGAGPADHVGIDNVGASRDAVKHLVALGCRRIAAIGAQASGSFTATLRMRGYREALRAAGVASRPDFVQHVESYRREEGAVAMVKLLALPEPPDAVLCFNDLLALGALRALYEAGVRVPKGVAVVGFDDIEESRYSVPSLTTISPDKAEIAQVAVDLLAQRRTRGRGKPPQEIRAHHHLEIRESTIGRQRRRQPVAPTE